jgi:hypothetical protein
MRTIAAGTVLAALVCAAPASARVIEIGGEAATATPTCPSTKRTPCQVVSRTTGYQARALRSRSTYIVPRNGRIVAWSIHLSAPEQAEIDYFNANFGEASAGLTILGRKKRLYHRARSHTPVMNLAPYFGQTVQFPLADPIPVKKGLVVALTVPTWAPALTKLLSDGSAWRASRAKNKCGRTGLQTAQTELGLKTQYSCLYRARLTYSATLITYPVANPRPKT